MTLPPNPHISQLYTKDVLLKLLAQKLSCEIEEVNFLFGYSEAKTQRYSLIIPDMRFNKPVVENHLRATEYPREN